MASTVYSGEFTEKIQLRLPPTILERTEVLAGKEGMPVSTFIRKVLFNYLNEQDERTHAG